MPKVKNWKSITIGRWLLLLLLAVAGCAPSSSATVSSETPETDDQVVLRVSGSGSVTGVLTAIQPAFEADVPGYRIDVLPGSGTGGGVEGLIQGHLEAAAMSRPPKDQEAAQNVEYVPFGQAGQAIITHPDVGITNLTVAQVVAIFSGEVTNLSEVGGADRPIALFIRDEEDTSTKELRKAIFGDTQFAETSTELTSQSAMLSAVESTSGGVGIATWPTALARGAEVKAVAIDGVAPSDAAYPMVGPIGIGYLADRKADVQPLIDWLLSESGQAALKEFGVIPVQ